MRAYSLKTLIPSVCAQMVAARRLVAEEAAAGAPDALAPVTNVVYMGMGAPPVKKSNMATFGSLTKQAELLVRVLIL